LTVGEGKADLYDNLGGETEVNETEGERRATIKAHPAASHHPRPYGKGIFAEGWSGSSKLPC